VHANFYAESNEGGIDREEVRLRTAFALRFGDVRTEERLINQDSVRRHLIAHFDRLC